MKSSATPGESRPIIAPSIFAHDPCRIADGATVIKNFPAQWCHIDVMDGVFVPKITFGQDVVKGLKRNFDMFLDVHLMVQIPENLIASFVTAGADAVTFHYESCKNPEQLLQEIKNFGLKAGISIKPSTPVEKIKKYLKFADLVLVMSVEPGACGQKFLPHSCEKINLLTKFRAADRWQYKISVDGGITPETLILAKNAGADIFVTGSAFFKDPSQFKMFFR